jgi:transcriptional regulator with XRE-family HTH domain
MKLMKLRFQKLGKDPTMNFSDKIKFQREQNHLTQKELAELVGVSQRAIAAYESSEKERVDAARKELSSVIRKNAKDIKDKYIEVPKTTKFGIMFLPFEGLYAEVARDNDLLNQVQSEVAGIKCKLPETVTTPYSPFTAVPNCVAYQAGLYGLNAANNGFWG